MRNLFFGFPTFDFAPGVAQCLVCSAVGSSSPPSNNGRHELGAQTVSDKCLMLPSIKVSNNMSLTVRRTNIIHFRLVSASVWSTFMLWEG